MKVEVMVQDVMLGVEVIKHYTSRDDSGGGDGGVNGDKMQATQNNSKQPNAYAVGVPQE